MKMISQEYSVERSSSKLQAISYLIVSCDLFLNIVEWCKMTELDNNFNTTLYTQFLRHNMTITFPLNFHTVLIWRHMQLYMYMPTQKIVLKKLHNELNTACVDMFYLSHTACLRQEVLYKNKCILCCLFFATCHYFSNFSFLF